MAEKLVVNSFQSLGSSFCNGLAYAIKKSILVRNPKLSVSKATLWNSCSLTNAMACCKKVSTNSQCAEIMPTNLMCSSGRLKGLIYFDMSDTDKKKGDEVLKRMLKTPPKPSFRVFRI